MVLSHLVDLLSSFYGPVKWWFIAACVQDVFFVVVYMLLSISLKMGTCVQACMHSI